MLSQKHFHASRLAAFAALSLGLGLVAARCHRSNASANDEIIIGQIASLTGTEATFGQSGKNGVALALAALNAKGGLLGKKLRVIVYDTQGKPEEAAAAITKLVTQDKAVAVFGEAGSSRTLAAAPIAQRYKVPLITPSSTSPKITEVGDYLFRVCFIDPFQGTLMAKFAREHLHAQRAAILRDAKSDYSLGLAETFIAAFTKLGGEIVKDEAYQGGDVHFKSQLTAIKSAAPDLIFVPGYYTDAGLIARQARELGVTVPLVGGDGWDSPKLVEIGGKAMDNAYFSTHFSTERAGAISQAFVQAYEKTYGQKPDAVAALAYDAIGVYADAVTRAQSAAPAAARDALAATRDFEGVTGKITIDAARNASKAAVVLRVEGGRQNYLTTVEP